MVKFSLDSLRLVVLKKPVITKAKIQLLNSHKPKNLRNSYPSEINRDRLRKKIMLVDHTMFKKKLGFYSIMSFCIDVILKKKRTC